MDAIRFKLRIDKCLQGIQFLAKHKPGITQYYVGKVFFFADKEHLLDWGRPISGDRYVAMEHGPVPSTIYDLIKGDSGEPDEILDELASRVSEAREGNKIKLFAKETGDFSALSGTDKEYLLDALKKYGDMPFGDVRRISHDDPAYEDAWAQMGTNNEMDIKLWFLDAKDALEQLMESPSVEKKHVRSMRSEELV
jgi:uncharacterized phage-associated protein